MGELLGKPGSSSLTKNIEPLPPPTDPKYGTKPNEGAIHLLLNQQLRESLHDPGSLQDLEVYGAKKDTIRIKGKPVDCWKVPYSFRAKNGFGALRQSYGQLWLKNDNLIQEKLSSN